MPEISELLDLPGGGSPSRVTVTIELVGAKGLPVEGFTSTSTVVGKLTPTITEGAWSATLVGNDDITPAGTVYKRTISGAGVGTSDLFEVPTTGGPYTVEELLTTAPASIEPSTYAVLADRVTVLEGGGVGLDTTWVTDREYIVGELVTYDGDLYAVSTAHLSGVSFDDTKFDAVGGGGTAAEITLTDAGGNYAATNVEDALAEAANATGSLTAASVVPAAAGTSSLALFRPARPRRFNWRRGLTHLGPAIYDTAAASDWSLSSGSGTFNADATDNIYIGDRSMKVTMPASGNMIVQKTISPAVDLSAAKIVLAVYITDVTKMSAFTVQIGNSTSYTAARSRNLLGGTTVFPFSGAWMLISINTNELSTVTGTGSLASSGAIRITATSTGGGLTTWWLAGVWYEVQAQTKGIVSFTFDDSLVSQYTTVRPDFDKRGWRATCYLMPGTTYDYTSDPQKLSLAQTKSLVEHSGWEVGAHSWDQAGHTTQTAAQLETQVSKTQHWIQSQGLGNAQNMAYWSGLSYKDAATREVLARYFRSCRTGFGALQYLETYRPGDPQLLKCFMLDGTGSHPPGYTGPYPGTLAVPSVSNSFNSNAVTGKGWSILCAHHVAYGSGVDYPSLSDWQNLVSWVADAETAGHIEVLTVDEALDKTSPVVTYG